MSGFAGVIFATEQFFDPSSFVFQNSILVLTVVIFGGMGSIFGVVLGAVVLQGLLYNLKDTVPANDRYIYFGAVIMLMMVFRPAGSAALTQTKSRDRAVRGRRRSCRRDADGRRRMTSLTKDEAAPRARRTVRRCSRSRVSRSASVA